MTGGSKAAALRNGRSRSKGPCDDDEQLRNKAAIRTKCLAAEALRSDNAEAKAPPGAVAPESRRFGTGPEAEAPAERTAPK